MTILTDLFNGTLMQVVELDDVRGLEGSLAAFAPPAAGAGEPIEEEDGAEDGAEDGTERTSDGAAATGTGTGGGGGVVEYHMEGWNNLLALSLVNCAAVGGALAGLARHRGLARLQLAGCLAVGGSLEHLQVGRHGGTFPPPAP